jgi:hypothetical protein
LIDFKNNTAASIVARLPAFIVVSPVAVKVVSDASKRIVFDPELNVRSFAPVDDTRPAPVKVRESISRIVPSILMFPRFASSSIVMLPVPAATSNSEKLIAVAAPLIDVRDVPLIVVVPVRLTVSELRDRIDPAAPLRGDILMFPVVFPPNVNVLFLRDWIVDDCASIETPLLFVDAASVATGVPRDMPVRAN